MIPCNFVCGYWHFCPKIQAAGSSKTSVLICLTMKCHSWEEHCLFSTVCFWFCIYSTFYALFPFDPQCVNCCMSYKHYMLLWIRYICIACFVTTDEGDSNNSFGSRRDLHRLADTPPPDWVVLGESVLIRPYNSSGVIAYIGGTDFSGGTWIGVELDAPTGEH